MMLESTPYPFVCPKDFELDAVRVLAGEYDIPWLVFPPRARILDIGAGVGAFSRWAMGRFPEAKIDAYEPIPENAKAFAANCPDVTLHPIAVAPNSAFVDEEHVRIYLYGPNSGCHSLVKSPISNPMGELLVHAIEPHALPDADVVKVDTEGAEYPILSGYLGSQHTPDVILFEWHSQDDLLKIMKMLERDYVLTGGFVLNPNRGTFKYTRKGLIKVCE